MRHDVRAARADRAISARAGSAQQPVHVPWSPVAGWVLLLVTGVLTISQWELVADTTTGRSNSFRDAGLSILLGLAGLRLAVAAGRHRVTVCVAGLAGLGLVLGGLLARHDHVGLAVVEVAGGCLALLCALAALASPDPG